MFTKSKKKKVFAIIGLGGFGLSVAKTLKELNQRVIAIDSNTERVKHLEDFIEHVYIIDATDEKALKDLGIADVDLAVVSVGENIEDSAIIVMNLQEVGVKDIIVKVINPIQGKLMEKLGVKRVIHPEKEMAIRLAETLAKPYILEEFWISKDLAILEIAIPRSFVKHTLKDLNLRQNYGINVLGIKSNGEGWEVPPSPEIMLKEDDIIIIAGTKETLKLIDNEF